MRTSKTSAVGLLDLNDTGTLPGAYSVRGMDCNSSSENDDDEEAVEDDDENIQNTPTAHEQRVYSAHVEVPVTAALVTDEVVVATQVMENPDGNLIRMMLCVPNPENHMLDETAMMKLVSDRPHLCGQKYLITVNDGSEEGTESYYYPLALLCRLKPSIQLVKAVYEAHQFALYEPNDQGQLPIHLACRHGADVRIIQFLLQYSDGLTAQDSSGNHPLHYSCQSTSVSSNVKDYLISRDPETVKQKNLAGELPLHLLLRHEGSESTILNVLRLYPDGASVPTTKEGFYPLHLACMSKSETSSKVIEELLRLFPNGAAMESNKPPGFLPLHLACQFRATSMALHRIMSAYPGGVSKKNGYDCYPLHYVVNCHTDKTILRVFCAFPEATREKDNFGALPLHGALKNRRSEEVIMEILSAFPDGAKVGDARGRLPLHLALSKSKPYSTECILHIVSLNEEAAQIRNDDGFYPLHLACMNHRDTSVISKLVALYPDALQARGERGRLPLHSLVARNKNISLSTVKEMVDIYPDAVRTKDKRGATPLALASNVGEELGKILSPLYQ